MESFPIRRYRGYVCSEGDATGENDVAVDVTQAKVVSHTKVTGGIEGTFSVSFSSVLFNDSQNPICSSLLSDCIGLTIL